MATKAQGHLLSNNKMNPKEQVNAITLRSSKELKLLIEVSNKAKKS